MTRNNRNKNHLHNKRIKIHHLSIDKKRIETKHDNKNTKANGVEYSTFEHISDTLSDTDEIDRNQILL